MALDFRQWKHVFKLDPDRYLSDGDLERICMSGTDGVMIGGSSGVTFANTASLLARVRRYDVPSIVEISSMDSVVPGADHYFIPVVLNTENSAWTTGLHKQALREYGDLLDWRSLTAEGYVILNGDSTAAQVTGAHPPDDADDLIAYARLADGLFRLPIFYVEYSGRFGNMAWVRQAKDVLGEARLFYGGGIVDANLAREAAEAADTIVVGNIIYEDMERALSTVPI